MSAFAANVFNAEGMAIDGKGNLYVGNDLGLVYKVTSAGVVSTFASSLTDPSGVAIDGSGNLFVANSNYPIAEITPAGTASTFLTGLGNLVSIAVATAPAPPTAGTYTVAVSASPNSGGTVTGGGTITSGSPSMQGVSATPNSGYVFADWTVNGAVVSTSAKYYFAVGSDINLVANFNKITYQTLDDPLASSTSGGGTWATGVDGGNIVGYYVDANGKTHGFLYNGTTYTTLDDPNGTYGTFPQGISGNNIVGYWSNDSPEGFLFDGSAYTTLVDYGIDGNTYAYAISGSVIVGIYSQGRLPLREWHIYELRRSSRSSQCQPQWNLRIQYRWRFFGRREEHGLPFSGGVYTDIFNPVVFGYSITARGVSGNTVVGTYTDSSGTRDHGFLYYDGAFTTLDDPNGINSTYAQGISGNTIVGYYIDSNNVSHGFTAVMGSGANYTVTVSASPSGGCTVAGGGTFVSDSSRTVTATANSGYRFANWTENGSVVSTSANYNFTVNGNSTLVANFSAQSSPIITSANSVAFASGQTSNFRFTATGTPAPTFSATGLPAWANLDATTGVLTTSQPNTTGSPFTIHLTAANGNLPNATQVFILDVEQPQSFNQWEGQAGFFTAQQLGNSTISGPTVTFENDAVPNLLKYLYDINPAQPMSATERAALPTASMTTDGVTEYLTLTYRQYALKAGLSVNVQTSTDLKIWSNDTDPGDQPSQRVPRITSPVIQSCR